MSTPRCMSESDVLHLVSASKFNQPCTTEGFAFVRRAVGKTFDSAAPNPPGPHGSPWAPGGSLGPLGPLGSWGPKGPGSQKLLGPWAPWGVPGALRRLVRRRSKIIRNGLMRDDDLSA